MIKETSAIKGCIRVRLGEEDEHGNQQIVGDSGWVHNMVVNLGVQDYLIDWLGAGSGGKAADTIIIGTGTAPASDATGIDGTTVQSAGSSSIVASRTFQLTNAWASGDHPGGTPAIRNAALADEGTGSYTIFCGGTFTASDWNSNQALSITYQVQFPSG